MTFEIGQTVKKLSRLCDEPQRISEALFDGNFEWYRLEFDGGAWHEPEELARMHRSIDKIDTEIACSHPHP
jgi:hypothetical protein